MQIDTRGEFHGLGIEISKRRDGYIEVVSPIEGTPAWRAGIQAKDQIVAICPTEKPEDWIEDCKTTKNMTLFDAVKLMRGKRGTRSRSASSARASRSRALHDRARRGEGGVGGGPRCSSRATATCACAPSRSAPRRPREGRSSAVNEGHRRARRAWCSTCATTRAACSTRRCASPTSGSTTADRLHQGPRRRQQQEFRARRRRRAGQLPDRGAGERGQRQRLGDRGRRAPGPGARAGARRAHLRQGLRADRLPARGRLGPAPHHRALLHAGGSLDPGGRHHARHRGLREARVAGEQGSEAEAPPRTRARCRCARRTSSATS
jgi:hypothetical protein